MSWNEEVALACEMRANYIETGNVNLSARDAVLQQKSLAVKQSLLLSDDQKSLVHMLRDYAKKLRT